MVQFSCSGSKIGTAGHTSLCEIVSLLVHDGSSHELQLVKNPMWARASSQLSNARLSEARSFFHSNPNDSTWRFPLLSTVSMGSIRICCLEVPLHLFRTDVLKPCDRHILIKTSHGCSKTAICRSSCCTRLFDASVCLGIVELFPEQFVNSWFPTI